MFIVCNEVQCRNETATPNLVYLYTKLVYIFWTHTHTHTVLTVYVIRILNGVSRLWMLTWPRSGSWMRSEADERCRSDARRDPANNKRWKKRHPDGGGQVETKQAGFNHTLKTLTALFKARGSPEGGSCQCSSGKLSFCWVGREHLTWTIATQIHNPPVTSYWQNKK